MSETNGKQRLSNGEFAYQLEALDTRTSGRFPELRDIEDSVRAQKWNVYNVYRAGLGEKMLGRQVMGTIEKAVEYMTEDEEDPDPRLVAS